MKAGQMATEEQGASGVDSEKCVCGHARHWHAVGASESASYHCTVKGCTCSLFNDDASADRCPGCGHASDLHLYDGCTVFNCKCIAAGVGLRLARMVP
jgi:hypothetical protein